jgi:hypothetical protein
MEAEPAFGLLRRWQLLWLAEKTAGAALLGTPSLVVGHDIKLSTDAVTQEMRQVGSQRNGQEQIEALVWLLLEPVERRQRQKPIALLDT